MQFSAHPLDARIPISVSLLCRASLICKIFLRVELTTSLFATVRTYMHVPKKLLRFLRAIDVWTGVCLTFVFGALLEFALVNYASRSDKHREKMKDKIKEWEVEHQAALQAQMEQVEHGNAGDAHAAFAMVSRAAGIRKLMVGETVEVWAAVTLIVTLY
ncbi:Neurotransmitter-gated ion-channel transmembrane domain [Trinorchestia longiramus]|nr:Neurotransmitter-gated ion-channel transmembrane domain [Trinorchestia longiramus]